MSRVVSIILVLHLCPRAGDGFRKIRGVRRRRFFTAISEGQSVLGRGPGATAGLAFFVRPHLAFGADLHASEHSGILPLSNMVRRSDGATTFVSLNFAYHFDSGSFRGYRIAPYVIAGAGGMSASRRIDEK